MTEDEPMIKTFGPSRPYPTLCNSVCPRCFYWCSDLFHPQSMNSSVKHSTKTTLSIMDKISRHRR